MKLFFGVLLTILFGPFTGVSAVSAQNQVSMEIQGKWVNPYTTEVFMKVDGLEGPFKWHVKYIDAYSCTTRAKIDGESALFHRFTYPEDQNIFEEMNCGTMEYSARDEKGNTVSRRVTNISDKTTATLSGAGQATASGTTSNSNNPTCQFFGDATNGSSFVEVIVRCLNIRKQPTLRADNIQARATYGSKLSWVSTVFTASGFPWHEVKLPDGGTGFMAGGEYSRQLNPSPTPTP